MAAGAKTGGRAKGTPNKLSGSVKENIAGVFSRIGGLSAMADWAKENPGEFYKIYARMLPVEGELRGGLVVTLSAPGDGEL